MNTHIERTDWYGCYNGGWQAAPLVPEAYSHPAKVSFALAERIYRHMLAEGWLVPGDVVVDPFGGIGGFAFHAALYGMHWRGKELEQKFVDLGNQNLALWRDRYALHFPNYGTARLVQGDSRRLVDLVTGASGIVSSPPYADGAQHTGGADTNPQHITGGELRYVDYGSTPGQLGAMPAGVVTSPPFSPAGSQMTGGHQGTREYYAETGRRPEEVMSLGNLGAMPAGAVITSPPYSETRIDGNGDEGASGLRDENGDYLRGAEGWAKRKELGSRYGESAGNLGNLPAGVVTSPPFGGSEQHTGGTPQSLLFKKDGTPRGTNGMPTGDGYGITPGQLGQDTGETFWSAAAQIVAQCHAILRPGGYAAFVTGDFVRNKKRVPFGEQWLALCVACGFEPVLWAVAHKSEHLGTQASMFGGDVELTKTKVSFFRRLANQNNPDAAITNEDVIFVRKPAL